MIDARAWDVNQATTKWAQSQRLAVQSQPIVASTNDWAKEAIHTALGGGFLATRSLFLAGHQTRGRGRGSHAWTDSHPGAALLSSWVFSLDQAPSSVTAPRTGLALIRAASQSFPNLRFSLKAPNDLYCDGKKLAGLLLENIQQGNKNWLIVGLGLNVWGHPALDTAPFATSLSETNLSELGRPDWENFLTRLQTEFEISVRNVGGTLSLSECDDLLYFLNLHPGLHSAYTEVSQHGDLRSANGLRPWTEI